MINNNDVMKKLRVALHLRDTDIVRILKLAAFDATETELSAIFRREDHPNFRPCGDQLLRRFLDGLIIQYRGKREPAQKEEMMSVVKPLWKGVNRHGEQGQGQGKEQEETKG